MTWDHHTDRRILTLHPFAQKVATQFIDAAENRLGITLRVTSARRTFEEQTELYEQGRTAPGSVVTWVEAGYSYHNYGLAIDVVEIRDKQAVWETEHWDAIGKLGEEFGFEWGGRWAGKQRDRPHFQLTFGLTTAELKALYEAGEIVAA